MQAPLFSAAEETQLCSVLSLSPSSLSLLLSFLLYLFETALYHSLTVARLQSLLAPLPLNPTLPSLLTSHYGQHRDPLLSSLLHSSFGAPLVLDSFQWRVHVQLDGPQRKDVKVIAAVTSTQGGGQGGKVGVGGKEAAQGQPLVMALGKAELEALYENLETIQQQLDALTEKQHA